MSIIRAQKDAEDFYWKVPFNNQDYFTTNDPVYLFTNEIPQSILKNMNLNGKFLGVTASFDHELNAILMGAKDITSFDINCNAKYFAELKYQAVKYLDFNIFKKFYKLYGHNKNIKCGAVYKNLNKHIVEKLCIDMDFEIAYFFERLLLLDFFNKKDTTNYFYFKCKPGNNLYLNENIFYELKEKIYDVTSKKYIDCNIFDIKNNIGKEKFSSIVFSNISSYFNHEELNAFYCLLKGLEENLEKDANIQIGLGKKINGWKFMGANPIDRKFVLTYKDNIDEVKTKNEIITYYHK